MTIRTSNAAAHAGLDAKYNLADAGAGPATVKVYTGAQPATGDTAESGTLLVTFTCADPAWEAAGATTARVKALDCDPDLSAAAAATGAAGWARMEDSTGVNIFDGSVGTSGTDFIINTTSITTGQTVTMTAGTITEPA
jgi:hypothetical protein